jgi:hypothetical protein
MLVGALAALFGLIHGDKFGIDFDNGTRQSPWRLAVGYAIACATLLGLAACQRWTTLVEPPVAGYAAKVTIGELIQQVHESVALDNSHAAEEQRAGRPHASGRQGHVPGASAQSNSLACHGSL